MNNIRLAKSLSKRLSLVCILFIICLFYLSCSENNVAIEMNFQNKDVIEIFDSYSYTQKDMTGKMVRYKVEFFPTDNDRCLQEFEMASGTLIISPITRIDGGCWRDTNSEIQLIKYPVSNRLPSFDIIDNLSQPDNLEGFKLNFYDYGHNLLRSESLSVEEWLFLIGEIHQLYSGYLQIDVSGNTHDLLNPE